jgi:hypothetical protein
LPVAPVDKQQTLATKQRALPQAKWNGRHLQSVTNGPYDPPELIAVDTGRADHHCNKIHDNPNF